MPDPFETARLPRAAFPPASIASAMADETARALKAIREEAERPVQELTLREAVRRMVD